MPVAEIERARMRQVLRLLGIAPFQIRKLMSNHRTNTYRGLRLVMEKRYSVWAYRLGISGFERLSSGAEYKVMMLVCYMKTTLEEPCFTDLDFEQYQVDVFHSPGPCAEIGDSLNAFFRQMWVPPMDMMIMNMRYHVHDLDSMAKFCKPYMPLESRECVTNDDDDDSDEDGETYADGNSGWFERLLRHNPPHCVSDDQKLYADISCKSLEEITWAFQRVRLLGRDPVLLQDPLHDFSMSEAVHAQCVQFLSDLGFEDMDIDALEEAHSARKSLSLNTMRAAAQNFSHSYCKGNPRYQLVGENQDNVHQTVGFGKRFLLYQAVWYTECEMDTCPEIYRLEKLDQHQFILWSIAVNWDLTHWQ